MAARHMQRMRALQEAEKATKPGLEDEEIAEEDENGAPPAAAPFNPFDLLEEDEEEVEAVLDADEDEFEVEGKQHGGARLPSADARQEDKNTKSTGGKKSKKKSRKKGKKGSSGGAEEEGQSAWVQEDDNIDAILQELNLRSSQKDGEGASVSGSSGQQPPLLSVDMKKLRAEDELRRIFGSKVVDAERAAEQQQLRSGQRGRRHQPRGGRRASVKKGYLIAPKEHWPPVDGGLGMERAGIRNGQPLFRYTYSASYAAAQAMFEEIQASYNPNNIAAMLQQHPFHVDALLAMSDLYRYSGEAGYSEEMLERCLYALETAWHPGFNPVTSACQLDYMEERNRPLFTALFRHMMNKSRQSCHNTALECCKLLLALDKDDPCGALQTIDYMALRAQQFDFLLRLVEEWDNGQNALQLFPNFAFSSALASFMKAQAAEASCSETAPGGESAEEDEATPMDKLIQAILLYPIVVVKVLERLQEKGVGKDAWWGSILERPLFSRASDGGSASLARVVSIFVERQSLVWKPPEVLKFLRTASEAAADIADGKRPPIDASADDWACVRSEVFPPSTENKYRHLQVMDFSDTVNRIPPEELQAGMGGGMAVPAELAAQLEAEIAAAQAQYGLRGGARLTDQEMQNANPLVMLLRSMLPWVDAGEEPEQEPRAG